MNVALVVGHDANKKGAYGNEGISEWDFNDNFLNDLVFLLPKHHTYYMFYRSADLNGYSKKMVDIHNRIDAVDCDVSIEFHFNSVADSSVHGNEVLYCATSFDGKELAEKLDECLDILPNRDRGTKSVTMSDNGGGFCCRGKSIALITEPFFGSNQSEYVHGTKNRELMKKAYIKFFEGLE